MLYEIDVEKVLNLILYLLGRSAGIAENNIVDILFLVDICHLNKYDRPASWVEYYWSGKLSSPNINDILNVGKHSMCGPLIESDNGKLVALHEVDKSYLSQSEMEIADFVLDNYHVLYDIFVNYMPTKPSKLKYSDMILNQKKRQFFKIWEG